MISIKYTSKAKDDLARINWKTRERIISNISTATEDESDRNGFRRMYNSELLKLTCDRHVIIGKLEERELNIITIQKQQKIKFPE